MIFSIIIPHYNYKPFLSDRILSIKSQTLDNYEIIFLDDASTDGSVELAERLLSTIRQPVTIQVNKQNSGAVFSQWQKGLDLAKGEYIWFAESDDACDSGFLEAILKMFEENPSLGLVYTDSEVIDVKNRVISKSFYRNIYSFIDNEKWDNNYINEGKEEIRKALFIRNTIPNASAVVMKTELLRDIGGIPREYSLSGDWMTYIRVLMNSDIAYIHKKLNYNRIHNQRVTAKLDHQACYFKESLDISRYVLERLEIPQNSVNLYLVNFFEYIKSSKNSFPVTPELIDHLQRQFPAAMDQEDMKDYLKGLVNQKHSVFKGWRERISRFTWKKLFRKIIRRKIHLP